MAVIAYPWRRCFRVGQELGVDHRADAIGVDWHPRFWVRSQRDGRDGPPAVLAFPCGRDPVVWGWRGESVVNWPHRLIESSAVESIRTASIRADPVYWGWRGRGRASSNGHVSLSSRVECRRIDSSRPCCLGLEREGKGVVERQMIESSALESIRTASIRADPIFWAWRGRGRVWYSCRFKSIAVDPNR
jgi:hypothetical protein